MSVGGANDINKTIIIKPSDCSNVSGDTTFDNLTVLGNTNLNNLNVSGNTILDSISGTSLSILNPSGDTTSWINAMGQASFTELVTNIVSGLVISGGTFYGDGSNLTGISGSCCSDTITFDVDTPIPDTTYIGYGEEIACKILRIVTVSGDTYSSFWSNGEETLDKLWINRYTYPYF